MQEMYRCLKPGGILVAVVPFLQPFHGYPDHYYNMTSSGLKNLVTQHSFIVRETYVPQSGIPIWTLTWFLNSYIRGLPQETASAFTNMTISDLLNNPTHYFDDDFVRCLSPSAVEELASTNLVIAEKI